MIENIDGFFFAEQVFFLFCIRRYSMFQAQKHVFSGQKHVFSGRKHVFSAQKHKMMLAEKTFFSRKERLSCSKKQKSFGVSIAYSYLCKD